MKIVILHKKCLIAKSIRTVYINGYDFVKLYEEYIKSFDFIISNSAKYDKYKYIKELPLIMLGLTSEELKEEFSKRIISPSIRIKLNSGLDLVLDDIYNKL